MIDLPFVGELHRSFAHGAASKNKVRSQRLRALLLDALLTKWGQYDLVHEVSLRALSYHTDGEGVKEVLNVREVEFHRCLEGDSLWQREARVEGRRCELCAHCINVSGLCGVCLSSLRISAYFKPQTVEASFFAFHGEQWPFPHGAMTGNSTSEGLPHHGQALKYHRGAVGVRHGSGWD